jgi:hypothetical protein
MNQIFSELPNQEFDWCHTVYGTVEELVPRDMPKALGKTVTIVTYTDANLYHDMLTGRSVTGILHLWNHTLADWYSRRQATVETATFGSEFTAARIAVDHIIDLKTTLRYLGVPVREKSYMFGDNQAVITNSSIPHSSLSKRHNALTYHCVPKMISAILGNYWIDGKKKPADIVSKHWSYPQIWHLLKPLLFYSGNTQDLLDITEDNTIMDNNNSNTSSQEASYHMFLTYNDNKWYFIAKLRICHTVIVSYYVYGSNYIQKVAPQD